MVLTDNTSPVISGVKKTQHFTKPGVWSGPHSGVVVSNVASQQDGSRFGSQLEPFHVESVFSTLWVLSGTNTSMLG